jgi:hypothetical protein
MTPVDLDALRARAYEFMMSRDGQNIDDEAWEGVKLVYRLAEMQADELAAAREEAARQAQRLADTTAALEELVECWDIQNGSKPDPYANRWDGHISFGFRYDAAIEAARAVLAALAPAPGFVAATNGGPWVLRRAIDDPVAVAALRAQVVSFLKALVPSNNVFYQSVLARFDILAQRLADTTTALERYGRHDALCAVTGGYDYPCNCGLDAALAALAPAPPTEESRLTSNLARKLIDRYVDPPTEPTERTAVVTIFGESGHYHIDTWNRISDLAGGFFFTASLRPVAPLPAPPTGPTDG